VSLTPAQAVALLAAVSAAPEAPYADVASVAIRKILDVLDPRTRVKIDELARRIWVNTDQPGTRAVRSALEEAMSEQHVVRIRYTAQDGNKTTRDVEPVIFASTNGHWYLVGWCQLRNEMRWFRMGRIEHAATTKTRCGTHDVEEIGIPPATSRSVHVED
jgi:predicted DNA-binding transcriptional regulator YafY